MRFHSVGRPTSLAVLTALGILAASTSPAIVLTFDGSAFGSVTPIPDAYGDRVTTTDDVANGFQYGLGNGFTPHVVVDYIPDPVSGSGQPFTNWVIGYGDLTNVLGHLNFNVFGEVVLTPDAGYEVVLNSFDVGAWVTTYPGSSVLVLDAGGTVLFDSGLFDAAFDAGHYTFPTSPIVSASALRIALFDYGDLGLDNLNFDERPISSSPVPEPASFLLMALGMAGLALERSRRARQS